MQRRYVGWFWALKTMSPYPIDGNIVEPQDRQKVIEAVVAYARVWLDLLRKAEPVRDQAYKQEDAYPQKNPSEILPRP